MADPKPEPWLLCDLGLIDYGEALDLQRRVVAAKNSGRLGRDVLAVLEHPPVFTLGRRGGRENLTVSEEFLTSQGIAVVQIERGGNITYHGPGQIVAYAFCGLSRLNLSVTDFVDRLETVMIRTAADFKVAAGRDPRNRGAWVGDAKLGSIGISIRHGVTFHGLALNVNTDLSPFSWINPCGLSGVRITSLAAENGAPVAASEARAAVVAHFAGAFGVRFDKVRRQELEKQLIQR